LPVQARVLSQAVTDLRGCLPALPVYSSPARRCLALARRLHPRPTVLTELQELDFGRWEGLPWDTVPRAELDAWAQDLWHYRPGGGESAALLRERWHRALRQLRQQAPQGAIVVSHAGLIRLALVEAGQLAEAERWSAPIAYATPYSLNLSQD
ncbi:histidine phosphatase family protein, partial [Chitinimonas sp.]|uniref:histidine phosphatase family protein n=1 Tax=Chitinimonas sp. TaxID=1934313 RepID=UPI002F93A337